MKERLEGFLKKTSAKRLWPCFFILAGGVALMLMGGLTGEGGSGSDGVTALTEPKPTGGAANGTGELTGFFPGYEDAMEKKLSETLSKVQGAGKVKVLLSFSGGGQIELAEDVTYETAKEADSGGDAKGGLTEKRESKHVLVTRKDGGTEPIVVKRLTPAAEGIIIVAEGGGDAEVKAALTKAAGALLNLPAHKIEVLKMSRQ